MESGRIIDGAGSVFSWKFDLLLPFLAFFTTLLLPGPPFILYLAVNFFLFLAASNALPSTRINVIVYPVFGIFLNSMIYGTDSLPLIYFLPFIAFSNYLMVRSFNALSLKIDIHRIFFSSLIKSFFLYITAIIYYVLGLATVEYLTEMGLVQFLAAVAGGTISLMFSRKNKGEAATISSVPGGQVPIFPAGAEPNVGRPPS